MNVRQSEKAISRLRPSVTGVHRSSSSVPREERPSGDRRQRDAPLSSKELWRIARSLSRPAPHRPAEAAEPFGWQAGV